MVNRKKLWFCYIRVKSSSATSSQGPANRYSHLVAVFDYFNTNNCSHYTAIIAVRWIPPPGSEIAFLVNEHFFYTHECNENEISYFKVDVNLIANTDYAYLGLVFEIDGYQFTYNHISIILT